MNCSEPSVFRPLFRRTFTEPNVEISWNAAELTIPQEMHAQVLAYWASLPKDFIFNGRLARLDRWSFTSSGCRLDLRPSDYRTLLYSNQHVHHICHSWGSDYLSRALGISAVVVSADNELVFMRRSANVGEFPECYDVFGGHIDVPAAGDKPNVFNAMAQELREEVGLESADYDLTLIGLLESTPNRKPELVFVANTRLPAADVVARTQRAQDHGEFTRVHTLANDVDLVNHFLRANRDVFSPSAYGSFCLFMQSDETNGCEESSWIQ